MATSTGKSSRDGSAKTMVSDQITQSIQSTSNLLHLMLHSSPSQAELMKLPKSLFAKTSTIKNTELVLDQLPRVISSLDAHMDNGLQSVIKNLKDEDNGGTGEGFEIDHRLCIKLLSNTFPNMFYIGKRNVWISRSCCCQSTLKICSIVVALYYIYGKFYSNSCMRDDYQPKCSTAENCNAAALKHRELPAQVPIQGSSHSTGD